MQIHPWEKSGRLIGRLHVAGVCSAHRVHQCRLGLGVMCAKLLASSFLKNSVLPFILDKLIQCERRTCICNRIMGDTVLLEVSKLRLLGEMLLDELLQSERTMGAI